MVSIIYQHLGFSAQEIRILFSQPILSEVPYTIFPCAHHLLLSAAGPPSFETDLSYGPQAPVYPPPSDLARLLSDNSIKTPLRSSKPDLHSNENDDDPFGRRVLWFSLAIFSVVCSAPRVSHVYDLLGQVILSLRVLIRMPTPSALPILS